MMWIKKLTAYGLLLALPALVGGCGGKCTDLLFTPDHYAYFLDFKAGDYWIYRNTQNGDLDSVYFVSQTIGPVSVPQGGAVCRQEAGTVQLKGFAKSLTFAYIVESYDGYMPIDITSMIDYYGKYDVAIQMSQAIAGRAYSNTITAKDCCLDGCVPNCGTGIRFDKLVFAKSVGIVRWQAIRHPKYGNVTYELIRSNRT